MDGQRLMQNSVLIRIEFKKLGNERKGDLNKVTTDADKDRLRLAKVLYDCPEYKAIGTFDNKLPAWLLRRAVQVNMGCYGVYIMPLALLKTVERKLAEANQERAVLIDKFMAVYGAEREKARIRLNGQFNGDDYPPQEAAGRRSKSGGDTSRSRSLRRYPRTCSTVNARGAKRVFRQ